MTRPSLQIVAACTDRKRVVPAARVRDLTGGTMTVRYGEWRRRLKSKSGTLTPAVDLYAGDYWSVIRTLPSLARTQGWKPELWVASAGYGLVEASRQLTSYSATFSSGHLDSVVRKGDAVADTRAWWNLATRGVSAMGATVTGLALATPMSTILVVASPAYLAAMADDLLEASTHLRGRGSLVLVSSKAPSNEPALHPFLLPSRSGLQQALGGALTSLHARTARHLLQVVDPKSFTRENFSSMSDELDRKSKNVVRRAGAVVTDDEVLSFIKESIKAGGKPSHTRLLREFRGSGRACEQSRFRSLFQRVTAAT